MNFLFEAILSVTSQQVIMWVIGPILIYLAIVKVM